MQTYAPPVSAVPQTLEQFMAWEPTDGYKYEWYEDQLIQFSGIKKRQYFIYDVLNTLFIEKGYYQTGTFIAEPDVMLTPTQMRRPDIAYFTKAQIQKSRRGDDVIPAFVVEVISPTDDAEAVEAKISQYFKAGVQVVWQIYPVNQLMYIYTARKQVVICLEDDVCSAAPVLPDFAIRVNELFALPEA
jgi:Uma2 family endonuclease